MRRRKALSLESLAPLVLLSVAMPPAMVAAIPTDPPATEPTEPTEPTSPSTPTSGPILPGSS